MRLILEDEALVKLWQDELDDMRARMNQVRAKLAGSGKAGAVDLVPLGGQNGLFSILPLSGENRTFPEDDYVFMSTSLGTVK